MSNININFLFGALTFLYIFMPLYLEIKNNYPELFPRFFIRSNVKGYGDTIKHKKAYQELFERYQITVLSGDQLSEYPGINFCVDGDTYGPREACWKQSLILLIDRSKFLSLSFIESLNFKWSYHYYNTLVDYTILPNKIWESTFNLNGKNLYLGCPKYDIRFDKNDIYHKYNLDSKRKYVIFFYPRFERGIQKYGNKFTKYYQNLMKWLEELGYTILTKNRTKVKQHIKIDRPYFVDTDYFPHISMELIEISEFAVFFGSAVIEEIVIARKPYVEFMFDDVNRLSFLRDSIYGYTVNNKLPDEHEFKNKVTELLDPKHFELQQQKFNKVTEEYLFDKRCCKNIIDKAISLYKTKCFISK